MDPADLLDYALGQLDGPPRERLESQLASEPALAERFACLAFRLGQLLDGGQGGGAGNDPARTPRSRDDPPTAAIIARWEQAKVGLEGLEFA